MIVDTRTPRAHRWLLAALALAALLVTPAAQAASTAHRPGDAPRTVTYAGYGREVHLGQEARLKATSRGFRAFVHARLLHLWKHESTGTQRCRPAATVVVKAWRSDGFARAGEGLYAPCPGGGWSQIYLRRAGVWKAPRILASQEVRECSMQRWFDLPGVVADRRCLADGSGEVVKYRSFTLPVNYSTGDYAASVVASALTNGGVVNSWTSDRVWKRLWKLQQKGADSFTVAGCFGPEDPAYGGLLGGRPRGCRLDVATGGATRSFVLQLEPARFGRWRGTGLVAL